MTSQEREGWDPLRVMSYNVRYPSQGSGKHAWDNRREPVTTTIRFHRPDVVGLQEAHRSQVDDFRTGLPGFEWLDAGRAGPDTYGDHPALGFRSERFTLEVDGSFWLSETPDAPGRGWDAALSRKVRFVRLRDEVADRSLYHFNTHFDHRGVTARRESALLLRQRIHEIAAGSPVVVTGDLNCRPGTEPYRLLTDDSAADGRPLRDTAAIATLPPHGPATSMTTFTNLVPEKKIDYVFVDPETAATQHGICSDTYENGRYPSDHLPVLADVVPDDA
ncbi:endonuclease/exonuclease/phosphatase family protein [Halorientalis halophila]|uniref:endonuclease/exonuclease/phosphatase family protein n=1 Tax=Halorientalis halophila TaxID=3108499 RepID=UPI0030083671